jgi:FixJ family two-component response regulator
MMNNTPRFKLVAFSTDMALLRSIAETAAPYFDTARMGDAGRAIALCEADRDVRVFMSEHAVHPASGTSLFDAVRDRAPHVTRVMLTTYADLSTIVAGLHSGAIQFLANKPVNRTELLSVLGTIATTRVAAAAAAAANVSSTPRRCA